MEKRTLIALALSFLVLGTYPLILQKLYPEYYKKQELERKNRGAQTAPQEQAAAKIQDLPAGTDALFGGAAVPLKESADHAFSTGKLDLLYTEADGSIRRVAFLAFARRGNGEALELFSRKTAGLGLGALTFRGAGDPRATDLSVRPEGSQVVTRGMSDDRRFRFMQTADWSGYSAKVRVEIENATDSDQKLSYQFSLGETIPSRNSIDAQYLESNFYVRQPDGKKKLSHIKETKSGKTVSSTGPVEWVAVKDRHFAVIVKPEGDESWTGRVQGLGNNTAQTLLASPEIILAPRGRLQHEFTLYIGPADLESLTPLGLEPIINFGKLDGIGRVLVGALELIHGAVRNYGVAIILLTIAINILLFPLTRASFLSMKRMQSVQPQMMRLREQHKNSPEKLNREMMELYKKHKVNPFGGCLPMLLQMPVFIALYVALSKSVILINARFLWIKDLSAPDSVPLPFSLPGLGNEIHLLPLIMSVAMAVQQQFSQAQMAGQDPAMAQQQKIMGVLMPVIFCFIFYSMPSGLVLYWLTNTILMASYQFILKRSTAPAAA